MQIINCEANSFKFVLFPNTACEFKGGQFIACKGTLRKTQGDPDGVSTHNLKAVLKWQD